MALKLNNSNILARLEYYASKQPNSIAYTFLGDKKTPSCTLTYGQLEQKSKAIAAYLQSQITPGTRVLLIYPPGIDFITVFLGCLYAKVIAIPAPSPETFGISRIISRLESIIEDAQPSLILTTQKVQQHLEKLSSQISQLINHQVLRTDNLNEDKAITLIKPEITQESIAYLQYTSGSTSKPKGVIITHDNLISNLAYNTEALNYQSDSILANWMPHYHDAGLIAGLLQSLYVGIPCYLMSPLALMVRPILLLEVISYYQVTHISGTNFIYDYCVSHTTDKQREGLDFSSLEFAGVGAEPIRQETLERFARTFQAYGFNSRAFSPGYGLAEATLTVTVTLKDNTSVFCTVEKEALGNNRIIEISSKAKKTNNQVTITGCGYPIGDTKVIIVNPETLTSCSADEVGEIWVSSKSVAQGYWNRSAESQQTFQAYLPDFPNDLFLRTGDLGFLKNGQLFVTGRLKDLIIIRGKNYYPQDLELIVESSHPKLRSNSSAIFSIEIEDVEKLVVTAEVNPPYDENSHTEEIFTAIRNSIAQNYQLPLHAITLLKRGTIPKTSSGKIQRHACRKSFLNDSLESIATWTLNFNTATSVIVPRNDYELWLYYIWCQVLETDDFSIDDNFFELGGNSLMAANVLTQIEAKFGQTLPFSAISEAPTIEKLANYLKKPDWHSYQRSLVAIKPQGNKRPFFYVHPRSGTVMLAGNLARYLDSERPFYGLQSVGLNGEQVPFTTVEDMAAHYIKEIQTIQPQGPYLLGGRCLGGRIAIEMGQQLLQKGQEVLLVVLIESNLSPIVDPILAKRIGNNIKKMRELGINQASNFQKVMNTNDLAGGKYQLKIYPGQVAYLSAEKPFHDPSFGFGWESLLIEKMSLYEVPGDHITIEEEPNIRVFSKQLSKCLNESELNSKHLNTYLIQGHIQHQQGNLEGAINTYQKAINIESDNAQLYFMLGNAKREKGNLEEAIKSYQKAIELEPEHYWYYEKIAEIFSQKEQIEETISAYSKVIKLGYARPHIYNRLASVQFKNGDLDSAIANYQQALSLNPQNPGAYCQLGHIKLKQGDLESAIAYYQKVVELNPDHPAGYNGLGHFHRQTKDFPAAITYYHRSLELNSQQPHVYAALGNTLHQLGQIEEAIIAYNQAITLDSKCPGFYVALGNAQRRCEQIEQGIASYQKAIELNPQQPFGVYHNLGYCLSKQGQRSEAITAYTKALKLQPNNQAVRQRLEEIKHDSSGKFVKVSTPIKPDNSPKKSSDNIQNHTCCSNFLSENKSFYSLSVSIQNKDIDYEIQKLEKILIEHPNVEKTVVVAQKDNNHDNIFIAYIIPTQEQVPTLDNLRHFLKQKQSDLIDSTIFVSLEAFPLTSDGNLDYTALPIPHGMKAVLAQNYQAPRNPIEEKLAYIWADVLWLQTKLSINDNFFALGGNSLLAASLITKIEEEFNFIISLDNFPQLTTIANISPLIEKILKSNNNPKPQQFLTAKTNLSSEIYQKLLFYTVGWQGKRVQKKSLIVGMNTTGTKQPLFCCLQGYRELSQLSKYLGEDQPTYGMRSGHLIMEYTTDNIKTLAAHYVEEILAIQSDSPYLLVGNCQGAWIIFEVAQQLINKGKTITLLCKIEQFVAQPYPGRVALLFGQESRFNPYKKFRHPELGYRKFYSGGCSVNIISGEYGQLFNEPNIQVLAQTLNKEIAKAKLDSVSSQQEMKQYQLLPSQAYQAKITAQPTSLIAREGETKVISVIVKNISSVTWQSTEYSGIKLGNHWLDESEEAVQWADGRTDLPNNLQPGKEIELDLFVTFPAKIGKYFLEFDLVEEGITWFKDKDSITTKIPVEVIPSETTLTQDNSDFYRQQGNSCFEKGDMELAIINYRKAFKLNPNQSAEDYQKLGYAYSQQENISEAIITYNKALELDLNNPQVYFMLGKAQVKQENLTAAVASYQKAIELQPDSIWFYQNLGQVFNKLEYFVAAIEIYTKAINLDSDNINFYVQLAFAQMRSGDFSGAIANYNQALQLHPENPGIYGQLGNAYSRLGNFTEAISYYQKAIKLDSKKSYFYVQLGSAKLKCEEIEQAITSYQKAIELNPKQPFGVYKNLGDALSKKEKISEAIAAYKEAIKLQPNNKVVSQSLAKLKQ